MGKQKHRDRDLWRQNRHGRGRDDRHRRNERDRDRSSGGRRVADTTDLRHRLNKDKPRDFNFDDRSRSDRHSHESRGRNDRSHHQGSSSKSNRFVEADKHKEKSRREVEEARRQRELLEKEMEIIADKLKSKK